MADMPIIDDGMYDAPVAAQVKTLQTILALSPAVSTILRDAPKLALPHWYLGAGVIAQTVWNYRHGFAPETGIKDCDLVYFDPDVSANAENKFKLASAEMFGTGPLEVEVTNEARVHLWYETEFHIPLQPYTSCEAAINSWPTTATSIGVRQSGKHFVVYAPYGLHDLLNMIVRPNKAQVTQAIYEAKVARWQRIWPKLTIVPW